MTSFANRATVSPPSPLHEFLFSRNCIIKGSLGRAHALDVGRSETASTHIACPLHADADLLSVFLTSALIRTIKECCRFKGSILSQLSKVLWKPLYKCVVHSNENQHVRSNSAAHSFLLSRPLPRSILLLLLPPPPSLPRVSQLSVRRGRLWICEAVAAVLMSVARR